jgi:hypothetical protein
MIKDFLTRLNTMSTMKLMWLCGLVGLGFMLGGMFVFNTGGFGKQIGGFFLPLGFLVWGLIGIPMIIRRELPWSIPIRGRIAVVQGIVLLVTGIVLSVFLWIVTLGGL